MGMNIILHSRKLESTEIICKELEELGVKTYQVASELTDLNQVKEMLNEIDQTGLQVDYVFNNAGLQVGYRTDYLNTPIEDYETSFLVNTTAPMMICYHFLPKMIERNFGRIVNTTSGIQDQPEQGGYSASKAALNKVTYDLGTKLNDLNVCINLVDPGWCQTDLGSEFAPNKPSSALPGIALGAFVQSGMNGVIIDAQAYSELSLEAALEVLESSK
jgi:short-subunit dehydrogenase